MLWDPRDELRRCRASPNKPTRYVLAVENPVHLPHFVLPVVLQELVLEEGWEHRVTTRRHKHELGGLYARISTGMDQLEVLAGP